MNSYINCKLCLVSGKFLDTTERLLGVLTGFLTEFMIHFYLKKASCKYLVDLLLMGIFYLKLFVIVIFSPRADKTAPGSDQIYPHP